MPHATADARRPRLRRFIAAAAFLILALLALTISLRFSSAPQVPAVAPQPAQPFDSGGRDVIRVLFIGNSLSGGGIPQMVTALSRASDGVVVDAHSKTMADAHLGDHWKAGANRLIAEGDWDFVILQQGPSGLPESREMLLEFARLYGPAIRAAGAQPAFYMVWPAERHKGDFDRVCESYRLAAEEIDAILLPAGEAWRVAWRLDERMPLYGDDRFHQSPAGSYLAALVIYAGLASAMPSDLADPAELGVASLEALNLSPIQVQQLKAAADAALRQERQNVP